MGEIQLDGMGAWYTFGLIVSGFCSYPTNFKGYGRKGEQMQGAFGERDFIDR